MTHSLPVAESIAVESTIESIQDVAETSGLTSHVEEPDISL
jgi:hypothetical protein